MSLIPDKCIEFHEVRNKCVASENGKTYTLINYSGFKIRKVKVDKCLLQKEGEKRCDYLISIKDQQLQRAIFIELKGGGLSDALKQIYSTLIYLKGEFIDHRIDARIIGSRSVPGFINIPDYKKLAREVRSTNGTIETRTNKVYSETI